MEEKKKRKKEGRIRHSASFSGLYEGWYDFSEKEILQEKVSGGGGRRVMIQVEHCESKMPRKHLGKGVEYRYRNKGLEFKRQIWVSIAVNSPSIGGKGNH